MTVRNFCVARGHISGPADVAAYTVPAGNSYISKSFILSNASAAAGNISVTMYSRGGTFGVTPIAQTLAASTTLNFSGWTVLNDGDFIVIHAEAIQLYYWIAGALLPYAVGQVAPALELGEGPAAVPLPITDVVYLPPVPIPG